MPDEWGEVGRDRGCTDSIAPFVERPEDPGARSERREQMAFQVASLRVNYRERAESAVSADLRGDALAKIRQRERLESRVQERGAIRVRVGVDETWCQAEAVQVVGRLIALRAQPADFADPIARDPHVRDLECARIAVDDSAPSQQRRLCAHQPDNDDRSVSRMTVDAGMAALCDRLIDVSTIDSLLRGGRDQDPAIAVPDGPVLSYARLREMVHDASLRLASFGVQPDDRVAIVFPNGPEAIVLFLAVANVATACPLNPGYKEAEFRYFLEDTGARFLLAPRGNGAEARRALPDGSTVIEAEIDDGGRLSLESSGSRRDVRTIAPADPDDLALVLHTSGTTSRPKRVPLRHRNLTASVANIVEHYRLEAEDVSLCVMPLFHVHGLVASALATLAAGGTAAVPRRFTPLMFWPAARQVRPTWFTASPTPHQLILMRTENNRPAGTERLRFVRSCSSALSPELMARMEERLGVPVLEAYGMTEASHQMSSNPLPPDRRVPGSVGRGTGVDIAILDEGGSTLPCGAPGEVGIRGPNVIDGYENNPQANLASFTNGWFRTGDQGTLDPDGYLRLCGRIKELINRGGEKIAPREIDEVLESHPAVKEAVCFGVAHPTWGEEVAAAVVLSEPIAEMELVDHCRRLLAEFKVPKRVHIVDSIPRTPTGKVQRRFVAEQLS